MKRLLGLTGLTCLGALTACFYLGEITALIIGICGVLLFIASMCIPSVRKEGTLPLAFLTVACSVSMFLDFTYLNVLPVQEAFGGVTAEVTAVQRREVYDSYGYYCYELDITSIDGEKVDAGLFLCSKEAIYSEPYDELTFTCELTETDNGSFLSKGIYFKTYLFDEPQVELTTPEHKPFMYYIINLRTELKRALYMEMDYDTAGFASAVLLGDKYAMEAESKELLRICGLTHISVVSGLHLSIVAAVCTKVFRFLFRNKYVSGIFTILAVIGFALLTGLGIPVIRSAVMLIIFTVGNLISRRSDSINSIGAAALLILIHNPYSVGDIGMLLSFAATLGIVTWSDKFYVPIMTKFRKLPIIERKWIHRTVSYLVYTVVCSLCATLWTMPIAMVCFGGFSSVSIIANLLTVPFLSAVIVCISLCAVTHYIDFLPLFGDTFAFFVNAYYDYLMLVCAALSKLPYAFIDTEKPYFYFWLVATLVLIAVAILIGSKNAYRITIIFSALILFCSSAVYHLGRESVVTLHIPDTGSALSVVMESSDGHAVLTCGGSKTKPYVLSDTVGSLNRMGKDVLVVTSEENSDIYSESLRNEFDYNTVLRYDSSARSDSSENTQPEEEIIFSSDYDLYLWDKAAVTFIPSESAVFEYISAGDTDILILPEDGDCADLDSSYRSPDIVITHGVVDNMGLLTCNTLIVPGEDFIAKATAQLGAPVAKRVVTGTDIVYDIDLN